MLPSGVLSISHDPVIQKLLPVLSAVSSHVSLSTSTTFKSQFRGRRHIFLQSTQLNIQRRKQSLCFISEAWSVLSRSQRHRMGVQRTNEEGQVVVVAVDARKEITDYALEWAVRNVIKAGDTLVLLALLPSATPTSRNNHSGIHYFLMGLLKKWGVYNEKEGSTHSISTDGADHGTQKINDVCVKMIKQLCSANQVKQVETIVKIITDAQMGSVAAKGGELGASWIILDRRLKRQGDYCLKQLTCNVILIDHAIPKFLRLTNPRFQASEEIGDHVGRQQNNQTVEDMLSMFPMYQPPLSKSTTSTSLSSLGLDTESVKTDNSHSFSSLERDDGWQTAPFVANCQPRKSLLYRNTELQGHEPRASTASQPRTPISKSKDLKQMSKFNQYDPIVENLKAQFGTNGVKQVEKPPRAPIPARRSTDSLRKWKLLDSPTKSDALLNGRRSFNENTRKTQASKNAIEPLSSSSSPMTTPVDRTSSVRKAISLSIKHPPTPPPLCSVCKHSAPIFGKAPRKFSYREMEIATEGFSRANFLAEGGYGPVYRGVLADGQVVAVKQHKAVSAQGASEFCSEVEVLSCAQHRNLVMLVGYCMDKEWLLVYEFACNGSLDQHLYGKNSKEVMTWNSRMKVAKGAARGLRYLHEDCRVGCIVHRDLRPNNILLTHDFEPMVGDFGLARWQSEGDLEEETRVVGTLGYLAPEYTRTGQITEKADVYAFGVLLMELISGLKAVDMSRRQGQQYLPDWGRPLVGKKMIGEMIDPRLECLYVAQEVECMMHAAGLCIATDPKMRPRMSKVLRMLEGDIPSDKVSKVSKVQLRHAHTWVHSELAPSTPSPRNRPMSRDGTSKMRVTSRSSEVLGNDYDAGIQSDNPSLNNINGTLVSEEYQAYLQGSLAEFLQKMTTPSRDERTMANSGKDERTMAFYENGYQLTSPLSKRGT